MDFGTPLLLSFEDEASLLSAVVVLHMDGCICLQKYRAFITSEARRLCKAKKTNKNCFLKCLVFILVTTYVKPLTRVAFI